MTLTDLLVASTPIALLMFVLAWRGIPTLIEWRRERNYQAEWHRTFGRESRRTRKRSPATSGSAREQATLTPLVSKSDNARTL